MKAVIQIKREGKWFVAVDLITNVADQGKTRKEAVSNLKKGLVSHYKTLMELAARGKGSLVDIEVEKYAKAAGSVS